MKKNKSPIPFEPIKRDCLNKTLIANAKNEDVVQAQKELNNIKTSKSPYYYKGMIKQKALDEQTAKLENLLEKNEVYLTNEGFELFKQAEFDNTKLNIKFGYSCVLSESQKKEIEAIHDKDKSYLASDVGQESEKQLFQDVASSVQTIKARSYSFFVEDNDLIIESNYKVRNKAEDIEDSFKNNRTNKNQFEEIQISTSNELENKNKSELKTLCKEKGLKVSGSKSVLIKRLSSK